MVQKQKFVQVNVLSFTFTEPMNKPNRNAFDKFQRVMSLILGILILNLCIQVPSHNKPHSLGKSSEKLYTSFDNRFILEAVGSWLLDSTNQIPDNTSSGLLEELNENHVNWIHSPMWESFGFSETLISSVTESVEVHYSLCQDLRFSPPPEA